MSVTVIGDATLLPFGEGVFDAIVTSPAYGNRMADHHDARDLSRRITYRHSGKHPARWSASVLERITGLSHALPDRALVLDPFAGVGASELERALGSLGRPSALDPRVIGVELDPDWARGRDRPINAPLHENNSGRMQWGTRYKVMHYRAWQECARVLKPGGLFVLNASDHIRANVRIEVVKWHVGILGHLGFAVRRVIPVSTPRMRMGANGDARVPCEYVVMLQRVNT